MSFTTQILNDEKYIDQILSVSNIVIYWIDIVLLKDEKLRVAIVNRYFLAIELICRKKFKGSDCQLFLKTNGTCIF